MESADDGVLPSLGYALLGMLARRPATGYDLSRRMTQTIGYFWTWRHSQIYGQLRDLEQRGLVAHQEIAGAGPRQTKRYEITGAGWSTLRDWVTTTPEPHADRDPLLLRVNSLWTVDPARAAALITGARQDSAERLQLYRGIAAEIEAAGRSHDPGHPDFAALATVHAGIEFRQGRIRWCDWLIARLGAGRGPTGE